MKKIRYFLIAAFAALAVAGCSDDDNKTPDFAVSTDSWSFPHTEGTQQVIISAPGAWTLTGVPDWMTVTPTEAAGTREIRIAYTANPTDGSRKATLTVTYNGETIPIDIEQLPETPNAAATGYCQ